MGKNKAAFAEQMRTVGKKIANYRPPLLLSCLGGVVFSAASILAVAADWGRTLPPAITYIVYVWAAVFLALASWSTTLLIRNTSPVHTVSEAAHRNRLLARLLDDHTFRIMTFAYSSLVTNILLALSKMAAGWWFSSDWLMVLAGYYLVLCLTKSLVLRNSRTAARQTDEQARRRKAWKAYRLCGWLLLVLTLTLQGVAIMIVEEGSGFTYRGYLVFAAAMYDFSCLIAGIVYLIKNRKRHSPAVLSVKYINFATSLAAILLTALDTSHR